MGPVLVEEAPFAHVVGDEFVDAYCAWCFKKDEDLKRCSKCHFLRYCGRDCQRLDFASHKKECACLIRANKLDISLNETIRLVGRVILKLKTNPPPAFNGRTLASLSPNCDGKTEISEMFLPQKDELRAIHNYLSAEDLPSAREIIEIWAKTDLNRRPITEPRFETVGLGLFLRISELRHGCDHDVFCVYNGNKAVLRALKPGITIYSSELRDSHFSSMDLNFNRSAVLKVRLSTCDCSMCVDDERDRIGTSMKCVYCESGYCCVLNKDMTILEGELRCALCDRICAIEKSAAIDIMIEIGKRLAFQSIFPADSYGGRFRGFVNGQLYRKASEVLSVYNLFLHQLGFWMRKYLEESGLSFEDNVRLQETTLACKKFYLPETSPFLGPQYSETALFQLGVKKFRYAKELYQKAVELLSNSYGPDHIFVKDACKGVAFCTKMINERRRLSDKAVEEKLAEFFGSFGSSSLI